MDTLGKSLKSARETIPMTLRQVEEATGISNAYLSQLENDKIKKPSANVLYKLSSIYKVPIENFLGAAGIIEGFKPSPTTLLASLAAENLTEEEEKELLKYLRYLRYQQK